MATSSKSATAEDERISPPLSNFMTGIEQYARNSQISSSTIPLSDPILDGVVDEGYQTNLDGHGTLSNSGNVRDYQGSPTFMVGKPSRTMLSEVKDGLEVMSRDVKKLVQGIKDLRHLGVEDLLLPLPKIAVVGDQSTGKSSLIEGISGIKVPRDAGCCTRCPLEINLIETPETESVWRCRISLCKKYVYDGTQGNSKRAAATRDRPLGPWSLLSDAIEFEFATITSKTAVPDILYWAQLATLNPGSSPENYLPGANQNTPQTRQVKFSPNVVRLDISGFGLPNLSFYDLPGVINVAEMEEERYLVKLVKNLVKEYIKADNCINLLTLPMTDDAANSSAAGLIKEAGAQGRTVGVLTKPDRVQEGESLEQWISILDGSRFQLGFGYHVIKNNPDPTVNHTTARIEESAFFANTEPYATKLADYKDRFGTLQLQSALSQRLTAQILTSLPRITEQVLTKIASVDFELSALPEPPAGNLPMMISNRLRTFSEELVRHIDGGSQELPFPKTWDTLALEFRRMLAESRPTMILGSTSQTSRQAVSTASQDPFTTDVPATPTPRRRPASAIDAIPLDSSEEDATPCKPAVASHSGKKRPLTSAPQSLSQKRPRLIDIPQYAGDKVIGKRFKLPEIRGIIRDAYIGLPGQIGPKATERMSQLSAQHWDRPLKSFLDQTENLCAELISERLNSIFGPWKQTLLFSQAQEFCGIFLQNAMKDQRDAANRALRLELYKPLTYNHEAMDQAREKATVYLQKKRREFRANEFLDEHEAGTNKPTSGQVRVEKALKVTDAMLGPDPYNQEVNAMGTIRGYYELSYSRFVDDICQGIQGELFVKCRNEISDLLVRKLRIFEPDANEHCALLLAVDPKIEEKRAQLRREMDKLVVAKQWLESLYREDTPNLPSRGRHMMVEDEGEGEAVGEGEEQGDVQGYAHDGSGSVV